MLRSLVGSEMCIRDSFPDAGGPVPTGGDDEPSVRAVGRRGDVAGVSAKGCLLYTSDAADDLLCVDLGGRRIIKKKKTMKNIQEKYIQPTTRTSTT